MRLRTGILLCGAAALLALAWVFWLPHPGSVPGAPLSVADDRPPAHDQGPPATTATTRQPTSRASDRPEAPAAEPQWSVLVRDAAGQLTGGAQVAWAVVADTEPPESLRTREERAWRGTVRTTDERGLATVPRAPAATAVYARRGATWGTTVIAPDAGAAPTELRLLPDCTIRVRTLDPTGQPAPGLGVTLRQNENAPGAGGAFAAVTAGPDARAEFPHVQALLPTFWNGRCAVVLDVPAPTPVFATVELAQVPDLVTLQLPPCGALHVRLVTDAGPFQPLGDETSAQLYFALRRGDQGERQLRVEFPRGELDLPRFGLGLHCRLVMDGSECEGALEFAGPTAAGEHKAIDLRVVPMPVLTGRIVDAQRAPRAGLWNLQQIQDTPGWLLQQFTTGADGRFRFRLAQPPLPDEDSGLLVEAARPQPDQQAFTVVARARLGDGNNDLGDLVLAPTPVLVAGRVVDQRGKGVGNARLRVLRTRGDTSWGLQNISGQDPHTQPDGTFAVRAHALPRELRLLAFTQDRAGEELPFTPPQRSLVYLLPATGALAAPVRCEGAVRPADLWFVLREKSTGQWLGRASRHVLEGGALLWSGLLPGRYQLQVLTAGMAAPLWRRDDLEIVPDETTRLDEIALGRGVSTVTIRVLGSGDQPVAGAWIVLDPDDAGSPRTALRSADGVFTLPLPRVPVDALVQAPGYRSARVSGISDNRTLRLEPGLVVLLHATVSPPLPADQRLVPRLRRASTGDEDASPPSLRLDHHVEWFHPSRADQLWQQEQPLDRDGRARLLVPERGDYEIRWWLDAWRDFAPAGIAPQRFTVRDASAPTAVEVEVALPPRAH